MVTIIAPPEQQEAEAAADFARLNELIESSRTEEARALAPVLAAKWPENRMFQHLARVLAPPEIFPDDGRFRPRSFRKDHEWLKAHGHEYPGCWIATYEDRLIAADPSHARVMEAVRATLPPGELAFMHLQRADP
jgi:hypothetical protein